MRRAAKVDSNHRDIVRAFEDRGCTVLSLAPMGRGVPDLLVGLGAALALVEVKTPKGKATEDQERFRERWNVFVVRDDEAVDATVVWLRSRRCL